MRGAGIFRVVHAVSEARNFLFLRQQPFDLPRPWLPEIWAMMHAACLRYRGASQDVVNDRITREFPFWRERVRPGARETSVPNW